MLQEAGPPPGALTHLAPVEDDVFWGRLLYDRWCLVVPLSERVELARFRQVAPVSGLAQDEIGVSGIGILDAARITPRSQPEESFIAVSFYARWIGSHPSTGKKRWIASDVSTHRILSDLSTFFAFMDPSKHRILASGDLNMFCGATGHTLSMPQRERTVWDRFAALGLEFLGPQAPNGRQAATLPTDVPADTKNVPTYYTVKQTPATATGQLDYAFASRGFHEKITVRALNGVHEWGSSDHCRLLIEIH